MKQFDQDDLEVIRSSLAIAIGFARSIAIGSAKQISNKEDWLKLHVVLSKVEKILAE
jgi:hypothetical protein